MRAALGTLRLALLGFAAQLHNLRVGGSPEKYLGSCENDPHSQPPAIVNCLVSSCVTPKELGVAWRHEHPLKLLLVTAVGVQSPEQRMTDMLIMTVLEKGRRHFDAAAALVVRSDWPMDA